MMTDTTPETSFNDNSMHDTSDELNTPNVSPEKDNTKDVADHEDFTHTSYAFTGNDFPKNNVEQDNSDELSESSITDSHVPKDIVEPDNSDALSETSITNSDSHVQKDIVEHDNSDELSESSITNTDSHVLFGKDVDEPSSTVEDSEDVKPSSTVEDSEDVKASKKDAEDAAETPIVIKKEKPENGEIEEKNTESKAVDKGLHLNRTNFIKTASKISVKNEPFLILKKNLSGQLILSSSNKKPIVLKKIPEEEQDRTIKVLDKIIEYSKEDSKIKIQEMSKRRIFKRCSGSSSDGDKASDRSSPPSKPTDNGTSNAADYDDENDDTETVLAPQEETRPVISVRKPEDLMITRPQMNGGLEEPCVVCGKRFPSHAQLEQHKHAAGHFSCAECAGSVFPTPQELGQHQASHHQSSVQQLAQQVQRLPAQFQSPSYRVPTPPQRNQYMSPPPMVPYYQGAMGVSHEAAPQTIGSGVVMSPVVATPPVPNLPPGIQLSKRPASQTPEPSPPKQRREEIETRRLPDSITLSRTPAPPPPPARNSVTDMLANRGITVVPSSGRSPSAPQPTTPTLPRALSSAISITPSSQQQSSRQQSNFAVPAPKPVSSRVLTVDLTKEADNPPRRPPVVQNNRGGRIRGPSTRSVCQICDKAFPTPQELQQHMTIHRGGGAPNKLAYECRECTAQYPTEAGLQAHRQKYHGAGGPSPDMAIPVVDLKQVGVMSRLAALGIRSVIPLSQLHSGSGNGLFGVPVVAVDAANNPAICNIGGLGASNLLPLGPLKNLTFNNNLR